VDPQELQKLLKEQAATVQSLAEKANAPDAAKDTVEQFEAAVAKFDEYKQKLDEFNATHEANEQRKLREARAKEIAEYSAKFEQDTLRAPNYNRQQARTQSRYRSDENAFASDFNLAMAAWAQASEPESIDPVCLEAAKRIGINPASRRFDHTAALAQLGANSFFGSILRERGNPNFHQSGFGAVTTYADSRDDAVLGLTNRMPSFVATIGRNMVTYGGILTAPITVEVTADYEDLIETFVSDLNTGRQIGEGQTIGTNVNPTDGNIVWKAFDYTSDDVKITTRQLQRSRMDLPTWIGEVLGERLGRRASIDLTDGLGAVNPHGILKATIAGAKSFTTASSGAIGYDDIRQMPYTIDEAFRSGPGVGWMMSEAIMIYLMSIKDSEGRPMFEWGWEGQQNRRTLDGYPVFLNRQMTASHAAATNPIIFGMFPRYKVRYCGSALPTLIRDETTDARELKVIFTAISTYDARLRDYGNCPLCYMIVKS
jgi:HK97 family phage major capsid protein